MSIDITTDCRIYASIINKERGHGTIMIRRSRETKGVTAAELNKIIRHPLKDTSDDLRLART